MKLKWYHWLGGIVLLLFVGASLFGMYRFRDRFPGYVLNLRMTSERQPFRAGFAKVSILPDLPDRWEDLNGNAVYEPEEGEGFTDGDGDGEFDAYWMAGFGKGRAANGVNDTLWARAMVIESGELRLGIVSLDVIGFGHDDVLRVRERLSDSLELDYLAIASTHTHEAPDLLGLWGKGIFENGVNEDYLDLVVESTERAAEAATISLQPATMKIGLDPDGASHLVGDTREPQVMNPALTTLQFIQPESGKTLGSLLAWADHPETTWDKNLLLTSDFPHYFREGVEQGLTHDDSMMVAGIGGISVFVNGSIGGLMTTHPSMDVEDPFTGEVFTEPSFEKARAQGEQLAILALASLSDSLSREVTQPTLSVTARTIELPLANPLYRLAAFMGVLERGTSSGLNVRSEIALISLGPVDMLLVPGEIYPELIHGGVEHPDGADLPILEEEFTPIRPSLAGEYSCIIGLANDEIGYIVPQSQWDQNPPYTYDNEDAPYGEINSLGPETSPILMRELRSLIQQHQQ